MSLCCRCCPSIGHSTKDFLPGPIDDCSLKRCHVSDVLINLWFVIMTYHHAWHNAPFTKSLSQAPYAFCSWQCWPPSAQDIAVQASQHRLAELKALEELQQLQLKMKTLTKLKALQDQLDQLQKLKQSTTSPVSSLSNQQMTPSAGLGSSFLTGTQLSFFLLRSICYSYVFSYIGWNSLRSIMGPWVLDFQKPPWPFKTISF